MHCLDWRPRPLASECVSLIPWTYCVQGLVWLDSGLVMNSMGPWKGTSPDPGGFMERAIAAALAQVS